MPMPQLTDRIKEAPAIMLRAVFAGVGQLLLAVDKVRNDVLNHEQAPKTAAAPGQPGTGQPAQPGTGQPAQPGTAPQRTTGQEAGNVRALREQAAAPRAEAAGEPAAAAAPPAKPAADAKPSADAKPTADAKPAAAARQASARRPAARKPATAKPAGSAKPAARKPATGKPATGKPATSKPAGSARPAAASPKPPAAPKPSAAPKQAAEPTAAGPSGGGTAPLPNYDELTVASLRARMRALDAAGVQALLEYERAHAARDTVVAMYERRLAKLAGEEGTGA